MDQWLRKCTLVATGSSGDGLDLSQFKITFTIKKTDAQSPNEAEIKVYNLAQNTVNQIQKELTRVTLQAGYQDNFAVIFDGNIKQVKSGRDNGTDSYLHIFAGDGDDAYNFAVVNKTLAAGSTQSDQTNASLKAMQNVKGGDIQLQNKAKLARGKVMYGMSRDYLRQSADTDNAAWSIQDGKLQIIPINGLAKGTAIVLNSKTGLIGTPEQTNDGIQIKALLNPQIKVGGAVKVDEGDIQAATIQSKTSTEKKDKANTPATIANDGLYKVISVEYNGDNRGNDWYCDIIALDIDETVKKVQGGV
jgi:hypothetical protein